MACIFVCHMYSLVHVCTLNCKQQCVCIPDFGSFTLSKHVGTRLHPYTCVRFKVRDNVHYFQLLVHTYNNDTYVQYHVVGSVVIFRHICRMQLYKHFIQSPWRIINIVLNIKIHILEQLCKSKLYNHPALWYVSINAYSAKLNMWQPNGDRQTGCLQLYIACNT